MKSTTTYLFPPCTMSSAAQLSFSDVIIANNKEYETKKEAIRKAMKNANEEIKTAALDGIVAIAQECAYVTSDDVLEYLADRNYTTHDTRFLGGIFIQAARMGWIRKSGNYRPSKRKECHHRPILIWESFLYGKP